ncbi:hypothetical protein EJ02DRAFT_32670 [Clathrospora elynae]|uniref:Zn(2)-C6 fungal-type domain-containing protein n=1 Tax=Clathrospora elynae TaxID=706981 RepID=A0A6A5SEH8_9PLEO|nr:hypothetical protein EJ02DRAFT_32670 [Clathrospora elynae]
MDDNMPPQIGGEFDFNLPHGIDAEKGDPQPNDNSDNHDFMGDGHDPAEPSDHDSVDDVQDLKYGSLPKGFSDDEDAVEAFDRSWTGYQARKFPSKVKKSPRRSTDGSDHEASPRSKRPRQSLFGGPTEKFEDEAPAEYLVEEAEDTHELQTPAHGIGTRMSSLNLEQQERELSPSERLLTLGFGLATSDRGSISPRASPAPSERSFIIPPEDQPAYELRQNIERNKTSTYIDQDQSGNFDPAEEAKQNALKLNKARAAKAAKSTNQSKKGKQRASKETVMKCIVRLRFEAFGNVRNYTNDEQNWPDDWSEIDSDTDRELQEYRNFFRRNTPGIEMQMPIDDPGGELDDLTGYPAARGCQSCRKFGMYCSMIENGTYPCQQCTEEGDECEPIIPSTLKGACKQCAADGMARCSFEGDPDQAICDHCADHELTCEALPPTGYRTDRINIDDIMYGEDRPYIQCTVCRQEKKRCSLKKKTDKPPCKYCKKNSIGCTFYNIPKIDLKKKGVRDKRPTEGDAPEVSMPGSNYFTAEDIADMNSRDTKMQSRAATPEIEMEDNTGRKGMLTKIKTSFAHPIKFGGLLGNTPDCNFCEMPVFGFVGLFEKEVHVIRWYSGLGYTEVGGGHAENNGATNMCQTCTMGRVQVIACPAHDIQHIYPDNTISPFEDAFANLLEVAERPIEVHLQLQRWCSMCFSPATFVCCTRQPSLLSSDDEEEKIDGCGIRLCGPCECQLREKFEGDACVMAATLDQVGKAKEGDEEVEGQCIRADVGFLGRDGLLMRSLQHEAEQAEY